MAGQLQRVGIGDLITAELMNQIIDELAWLRQRVTSVGTSTGGVTILRFLPSATVRVGDELTIEGLGFGDPSRAAVTIGSEVVRSFRLGSGNERLILVVPAVQGIGSGRTVTVMVAGHLLPVATSDGIVPEAPLNSGNAFSMP